MSRTVRKRRKLKEHDVRELESNSADLQRALRRARITRPKAGEQVVNGVRVSDHAVVRFLEIVCDLNIRQIRELIVSEGRWQLARGTSFCKLPINGSAKIVVKDGAVVTILRRASEYDTKA